MEKIRKCAACRAEKTRSELIKITKLQNGLLKINPTSKELGRSVYVCKTPECIKKFIKKKALRVNLKYNNQSEIDRVEEELNKLLS